MPNLKSTEVFLQTTPFGNISKKKKDSKAGTIYVYELKYRREDGERVSARRSVLGGVLTLG